MKLLSVWALVGVSCLLASGCAVTTPVVTEQEISSRITSDRELMLKGQEPVAAPLTLEEVMARSIKYNLDHRLKLMDSALALRQLDLASYDMLPRLVASAGYTERNSYSASSSMDVTTGNQSLATSASQDKGHYNGDLTLTWNILDFGVSYFQAKQQSDRFHIMKERRRKAVHTIMQQVRQQYWLALGTQQLEGRFALLLKTVEKALRDSVDIEQEKLRPPLEALNYRKSLLDIIKQLESFRDEMVQAKPQLASLMNLPPGEGFAMVPPAGLELPKGPEAVQYLEIRALQQRPELFEADYNERISLYETRKAIARMLPGIELSVGGHYDSNSFLMDKQWVEGGARMTWNLMNVFTGGSQYKIAKSQMEITQLQRTALSMAILTQVHVAYQNFYSRKRQFELSGQMQDIETKIYEQTMNQTQNGAQNILNEIRTEASALMAEYRSYQNYAALQNACGQIIASIGEDPLPETVSSYEIGDLAKAIGTRINGASSICAPVPKSTVPVGTSRKAVSVPPVAAPATVPVAHSPAQVTEPLRTVAPAEAAIPVVPVVTPVATAIPAVVGVGKAKAAGNPQPDSMAFTLQFSSAESDLTTNHHAKLKELADFLKMCPEVTGEISGYSDNTPFLAGSGMNNMALSQQRAENIRTYIVTTYGIDPKRIVARGYGASRPVADNSTETGKRLNRRIEARFNCEKK